MISPASARPAVAETMLSAARPQMALSPNLTCPQALIVPAMEDARWVTAAIDVVTSVAHFTGDVVTHWPLQRFSEAQMARALLRPSDTIPLASTWQPRSAAAVVAAVKASTLRIMVLQEGVVQDRVRLTRG